MPGKRGLACGWIALASACAASRGSDDFAFWLRNAVVYHDYTDAEVAAALDVVPPRVTELLAAHGVRRRESVPGGLRVLPYPGGRHPRIGFLEGAIDPQRDTKASVFLPWPRAGYVVVDLPEAIWWRTGGGERELLYLAHTHIPTRWSKLGIELPRIDWTRTPDGGLRSHRRLPNGVEFQARVTPAADRVDLEMTLKNGTAKTIRGLRAQICVMLKGAPAFAQQTDDNKSSEGAAITVRDATGRRSITTEWERARTWSNSRCPCMHSDPTFPDLAPGAQATLRGRISCSTTPGMNR